MKGFDESALGLNLTILVQFWKSTSDKLCSFHDSFLVLLSWTFLVCFSGPPTPSSQKGVGEPQKQSSNVQNRDSKSKRDSKNSILV